jgi:TolB-like protein/tetratricopeptide (TPR) repeat protein
VGLGTLFMGYQTVQTARAEALGSQAGAEGTLPLNRVAVLYFSDESRDGSLDYLADNLTESLIERLDEVNGLDVISRSGSAAFRDSDLPRDSIASVLSAGTIVEGSVEARGDAVRVSVTLYDGESGAQIQRQTMEESADDPFALQDDLADQVATQLREWLGDEISLREARRGTESIAAWTMYQRGVRARRDADAAYREGDVAGFIREFQRADSLFISAQEADPDWTEPLVLRARLAFRWGELSYEEPEEALEYLQLAIQRADQVLAVDPRNGRAYYVRGISKYLIWELDLTRESGTLEAAVEDLEQATTLQPDLAGAWNALSIAYSQASDIVGANLAARRALEEDEFLSAAPSVLATLYKTSYDLENFRDALRYCDEGHRRFPEEPEFTECQLWLTATRAVQPDPAQAWDLLEAYLGMLPEHQQERERISGQLVVAMVLAQAELPDSALAVVSRSQAPPALDPTRELLAIEALVHLQLDDPATAVDRLRLYLTASPEHREGWQWSSHWWWRELQNNPDFRRLMGG